MDCIPITFEHSGKTYKGYFHKIAGAGSNSIFHLMDNEQYYLGRLRVNNKWIFDESKPSEKLAEKAEFFGDYITAWYE